MWAQGLTIGIVIAAGILTHSQRAKDQGEMDEHRVRHLVSSLLRRFPGSCGGITSSAAQPADHSWQDILAQEEKEEKERAARSGGAAAGHN